MPLTLVFCESCSLLQLRETVNPAVLFGDDYPYFSSTSTTWVEHCRDNAAELVRSLRLGANSRVVEIASNDGYMLRHFVRHDIPVLGIDPSPSAAVANQQGIPTLQRFFDVDLARELRRDGVRADLVIANNVLAHVADLHGFLSGVTMILSPGGSLVLEVGYVRDLVDKCAFDTIYHQHLCYFSLTALAALMGRHGLRIYDARRVPTQGGSLRLYVSTAKSAQPSVNSLLSAERSWGVGELSTYRGFETRLTGVSRQLADLVGELKARGKRIVGYGAAAKATTLLNVTGLDGTMIDYVVDLNPYKQGKYMPGTRLEIRHPDAIEDDRPDYILLLAWNLKDEILRQNTPFLATGGKLIVPLPALEVLGGAD